MHSVYIEVLKAWHLREEEVFGQVNPVVVIHALPRQLLRQLDTDRQQNELST